MPFFGEGSIIEAPCGVTLPPSIPVWPTTWILTGSLPDYDPPAEGVLFSPYLLRAV